MICPNCGQFMIYEGDIDDGTDDTILICESWYCDECEISETKNCYTPEDE